MFLRHTFAHPIIALVLALAAGVAAAQQPGKSGPGPGMMGSPGMMGGYGGDDTGMMGSGHSTGGPAGCGPGYGMGPGMMGGDMMVGMMGMGLSMERALWRLNLNDNQRKDILKVHDELRKKNWELTGKMQDEMAKLRDASWASGKRDRTAILSTYRQLGELRQQRFEASLDAADKVEKVLTAEQRDDLKRWGPWWMMGEVQ